MKATSVFTNRTMGWDLEVIEIKGDIHFFARGVAAALGLTNISQMLQSLDADEKGIYNAYTPGGTQAVSTVTEAGLYTLILRSRRPEAKAFRRWVTHEVLPAIRKHGIYATPMTAEQMLDDPELAIKLLRGLQDEREKREASEVRVAVLEAATAKQDAKIQAMAEQAAKNAPKVTFANAVQTCMNSVNIGNVAEMLYQAGYEVGQNRLFKWLRNYGYLIKNGRRRNMPTQWALQKGWFEVKESTYPSASEPGTRHVCYTTLVTGRGQLQIVNHFIDTRNIPSVGGRHE